MQSVAQGGVFVWAGGALWIGEALGPAELHSHHAVQITLGPTGEVKLRQAGEAWVCARAVIVKPDVQHEFDASGMRVAHVFAEPESATGRRLIARYCAAEVTAIDEAAIAIARTALVETYAQSRSRDANVRSAQEFLHVISGVAPPVTEPDARVVRAIAYMRAHLHHRRGQASTRASIGRFSTQWQAC